MKGKTFGGQCGECSSCGKCDAILSRQSMKEGAHFSPEAEKQSSFPPTKTNVATMEQEKDNKTLYTFIIYTENLPGLLSQITAVFTRRQVNIESLNVSASSIKGVHKYTITAFTDQEGAEMIVKQTERKVDVVKADYYLHNEVFLIEVAIFKLSTPIVLANQEISRQIRHSQARITEVNSTFCIVSMAGVTEQILDLFRKLNEFPGCVLQYARSGRIVVTRSCQEKVNAFLHERGKAIDAEDNL